MSAKSSTTFQQGLNGQKEAVKPRMPSRTSSSEVSSDKNEILTGQQNDKGRTSHTTKFGNITITTNASRYFPGETMDVNILAPIKELNGTMEWKLYSPLNESIFGFDLLQFLLLQNFDFRTNNVSEWTNDPNTPFDFITVSNGYLNLTELADADLDPARVYVNNTGINLTKLTISFDYLGLTPNLVANSSFEDVTGWTFNASLVSQSSNQAHSGSFSLFANKTPSNTVIAKQNVTVQGKTRLIISAWGTGINSSSYWRFRITAYNSSGEIIGSPKNSSLSTTLSEKDLENGFGMLETTYLTPPNTSFVQIELIGFNSSENGTYTGYFDDVMITVEPSSTLELQYYNGTNWINVTNFQTTTHKWNRFKTTIELNSISIPANGTIFAFVLPDNSTSTTDPPITWLLDNFTFVKITPPIGRLSLATEIKRGSVNATRIFTVDGQVKNETLSSSYEYLFTEKEGKPVVSINFTLTLPKEQVYYGPHSLDIIYYPNVTSQQETKTRVVLSHLIYIEDTFRFEPLKYYALRGTVEYSYNDTQQNQTVTINQVFFEEEPERIFSPGDNITIIGLLVPESAEKLFNKTAALDTSFYKLENGFAKFEWQGVTGNITWGENGDSILRTYSSSAKDIAHGNFTVAYPLLTNYTKFIALNFVIPSRGIFGTVNSTLFFDFKTTLSPAGHRFNDTVTIKPYTVNITLATLDVKFRVNITQSLIPTQNHFVPLQSIDGTFTVDPLHARTNLLDKYQFANITLANGTIITVNRTIHENITQFIPLNDLHLKMFLDAENQGNLTIFDEKYDITIAINRFGNKFSWFYKFSPNDLNGTYILRVLWLEAEKANDTALKFLAVNTNNTKPTELSITLSVNFNFKSFYSTPISIIQGKNLLLNFTFTIDELGTDLYIPGINLNIQLDDNDSLVIAASENNGIYTINLDTKALSPGTHTIDIYHRSSGVKLATITFTVELNPALTTPSDKFTPPKNEDPATTLLSTIIIGIAATIALGLVILLPKLITTRKK